MNRQKNIFTYILITAMMWNVLYVPLTYTYYYVDQTDFIAQFCDNIDKPEMKCDGKCHLKEVTEKDATNDKAPSKMLLSKSVVLFVQENLDINFEIVIYKKIEINKYHNLYAYLSTYSLFHPPQEILS
tara:strand:+ start:227 stop:610 length:384 start_codon:yes stop_codon:yes gene_type:complete